MATIAGSREEPATKIIGGSLESFHEHLGKSKRILALLGAGLSASSGLPTFRGAGGLWRNHDAMDLATPQAFDEDPGLVWQFYSYRRHMALKAKPNKAHYALAELARIMEKQPEQANGVNGTTANSIESQGFCCLSQNVDGLSQRTGHPRSSLQLLHGSLFDIKCTDFYCKYAQQDNFTDPIAPSLAIPTTRSGHEIDVTTNAARQGQTNGVDSSASSAATELDISLESVPIPTLTKDDLPHCPQCHNGLLRPGVVWFGEMLPERTIRHVDEWITRSEKIDLIMVIGTSARVYPAAGYVQRARGKGARVAVVNTEEGDMPSGGLMTGDWGFVGGAERWVPEMLRPLVGDLANAEEVRPGERL